MNHDALLKLWELDEIPAREEGLKIAQAFLVCAGEAVDRLGVEEPDDRITQLTAAYVALVEHGNGCDNCKESENPWKAANLATMPHGDDIPADSDDTDQQYQLDREIGFHAGAGGAEPDDSQFRGWQRGWADGQE